MRESPRLLLGAASPHLVVVEPVDSPAGPARRREARIFSLIALVLGLAYLIWLGRLVLASRGSPDIFFFAAESLSYLLLCLLSYSTWRLRSPRWLNPESPHRLSVDILVPCCGEPLEIIETTLKAVRRITYNPLEVYVLDDAASGAVAALAQSLGFHYLSRLQASLPRTDSKSGNLNFGMGRSRGELILVLDADQVPAP
jgi:cellulose synthase (UDP-forming)